jgi:hypothetical protein
MATAIPGMPVFFIRSPTRPSTLDMASSMRLAGISRPDTSLGGASDNGDGGGLDTGGTGLHPVNASKAAMTAAAAARFVMAAL